jgi:hypothetical protein
MSWGISESCMCVEECIDNGREVQEELHKEHEGEEARRDARKC